MKMSPPEYFSIDKTGRIISINKIAADMLGTLEGRALRAVLL